MGNANDDGTHVSTVVQFQAMKDDLQRLNELIGQRFDERITTQAKAESK